MKLAEIIKIIEDICPLELMEEWDNSGAQISFTNKDINSILVTLEVTKDIIQEAKDNNVDLIITHHPLYFGPISSITDGGLGYTMDLIKSDISVYSTHTNFDKMVNGNNDFIGNLLGISNIRVADSTEGFGRIGSLDESMSLENLGKLISEKMSIGVEDMRFVGDLQKEVKEICWCSGAGASFLLTDFGRALKADVYITGDVKYHDAMYAMETGMNVIDIGHYGSEIIFVPNMSNQIKSKLQAMGGEALNIKVLESTKDKNPFKVL